MFNTEYDVVYKDDYMHSGWVVFKNTGVVWNADTKKEAVRKAKEFAKDEPLKSQVILRKKDGTIQDKLTY